MSLSTVIAAIIVALVISAIAATAGYYLQTRLRRLEELEEEHFAPILEMGPVPARFPPPAPEEELTPIPPIPEKRLSIAASLEIVVGLQTGQSFRLGINTLIGRDPNLCDIVINDPMVSGQHARIRQEGDQFYIYDLGSTNGTFVNGESVLRAELHDGDRILMGSTELKFKRD